MNFPSPRAFLLLLGFAVAGCDIDREGELVTHWIACQRSQNGDWTSADKDLFSRFGLVHESRYQVSFAGQRVVSAIGYDLKKCTVYDRRNWTCIANDGSSVVVKDGESRISCGRSTGLCFLDVGIISRTVIVLRGVEEADRLCKGYSDSFDIFRKDGREK